MFSLLFSIAAVLALPTPDVASSTDAIQLNNVQAQQAVQVGASVPNTEEKTLFRNRGGFGGGIVGGGVLNGGFGGGAIINGGGFGGGGFGLGGGIAGGIGGGLGVVLSKDAENIKA